MKLNRKTKAFYRNFLRQFDTKTLLMALLSLFLVLFFMALGDVYFNLN